MSWFRRWFARRPNPTVLLNDGLALAMDWGGGDWLSPINERLRRQHPHLSAGELDELDGRCRRAMQFGHETAYALATRHGKDVPADLFADALRAEHPWMDDENVGRLMGQSLYFVWKAGGPPRQML